MQRAFIAEIGLHNLHMCRGDPGRGFPMRLLHPRQRGQGNCLGNAYARMTFQRLTKEGSEHAKAVVTDCYYFQFPGERQKSTPCMTIRGLQRLLTSWILPSVNLNCAWERSSTQKKTVNFLERLKCVGFGAVTSVVRLSGCQVVIVRKMEVALQLTDNASLRGMEGDEGMWYWSVYDFVNFVTGREPGDDYGGLVFRRLVKPGSEHAEAVRSLCSDCQFPGERQKPTPCMTLRGLQRLFMILGGKVAVVTGHEPGDDYGGLVFRRLVKPGSEHK